MGQGSPKELIKAHKNAELGKGPKGPKKSKWAKDAQRNQQVQGVGQIAPQQE